MGLRKDLTEYIDFRIDVGKWRHDNIVSTLTKYISENRFYIRPDVFENYSDGRMVQRVYFVDQEDIEKCGLTTGS